MSLATLGYSIAGGLQAGTSTLPTLGYGIGEGVSLATYCIEASQLHIPGSASGEIFTPGTRAYSIHVPGADAGQVGCC